ncbi:MAG TPA: penicillin-binding transpeptidase domain-containing protein [Puia sp.]
MPRRFLAFLLIAAAIGFTACSTNNVTVDDSLQKYFDSAGVHGTFGFYDNGQGHFTIYNLARFRDSTYSPGNTFDILQALIAVQTGLAADEHSALLQPDSAGPAAGSVRLAAAIGKDTLKKWVDSLRYGNRDLSEYTDPAHPAGRLKISADEQLGLTKKLYFDQLPFFQRTQKLVKQQFRTERNSNYLLAYTTGIGTDANGKYTGWIMGWVEENNHPYFFVVNMEVPNGQADVSTIGLQLVKNILGPMGFFAGKK